MAKKVIMGPPGPPGKSGNDGNDGKSGPPGLAGVAGATGAFGGNSAPFTYDDSSIIEGNPGSADGFAKVRFNSTFIGGHYSTVSELYVNTALNTGPWVSSLDLSSPNNPLGFLRLFSASDPDKWLIFKLNEVITGGGYRKLIVLYIADNGTISGPFLTTAGDLILSFSVSGNIGPFGPRGFQGEQGEQGIKGPQGIQGIQGIPGSGGSATTVEVNLSSTATWRGKFTITDAAITATSKILAWQAPGPYTGKGTLADEAELQPVSIIAVAPATGTAIVHWETPPIITSVVNAAYRGLVLPINTKDAAGWTRSTEIRRHKVRGNVKFSYVVFA